MLVSDPPIKARKKGFDQTKTPPPIAFKQYNRSRKKVKPRKCFGSIEMFSSPRERKKTLDDRGTVFAAMLFEIEGLDSFWERKQVGLHKNNIRHFSRREVVVPNIKKTLIIGIGARNRLSHFCF